MDERLQKAVEERLQRLQRAAVKGDVDALFSILEEDPLVLERNDEKAFLSTPLHTAVREGRIQFAKEIVNLKPSYVCKRDHLGRSPLHLALEEKDKEMEGCEKKYQELVTWLIQIDSELVRIKSKGMITPLHYAAQLDDVANLEDFLYVCPSSIQDLTVKSETAVHVAIKSRSFTALKFLLKWLRRNDKEEILSCKDEQGNNVLHTAISENQTESLVETVTQLVVPPIAEVVQNDLLKQSHQNVDFD
ncbi:ankyrin repeat-containing protein BDA1-like [Pistacia vera]|uniref:ankyrin repeat-containing protein BDA1-like n=1 Tax=Pistacia vera TaxID=55513 RepID=UPI0012635648|nr:ankyrin repeat-containing protein BDA1-like [Pistacia vera]